MTDQTTSCSTFKCYYTDAPLFDRVSIWTFCSVMIIVMALIHRSGSIYPVLTFDLIFMLIPLWFEFMVHMIRTRSVIELTDSEIVVRRWLCRQVSFPLDKIASISVVDFDTDSVDKLTRDYMLPMAMGRVNLYPQKGVIVFFERKWIKSVRPIFFNAADPDGFAMALSEKSGKPVSMKQQAPEK